MAEVDWVLDRLATELDQADHDRAVLAGQVDALREELARHVEDAGIEADSPR
jgi:hypothetical protein